MGEEERPEGGRGPAPGLARLLGCDLESVVSERLFLSMQLE